MKMPKGNVKFAYGRFDDLPYDYYEVDENSPRLDPSTQHTQQDLMDQALAAIYNGTEYGGFGTGQGGAGTGPSTLRLNKWLGDVRDLFDKDLVTVIQNDAMNRCGLKQLILEPELLENLEPDINLATSIMLLKDQIPAHSKESVRVFIKKI